MVLFGIDKPPVATGNHLSNKPISYLMVSVFESFIEWEGLSFIVIDSHLVCPVLGRLNEWLKVPRN